MPCLQHRASSRDVRPFPSVKELQRPGAGRGITILSKNTAVHTAIRRINIVDTPGHSGLRPEKVERVPSAWSMGPWIRTDATRADAPDPLRAAQSPGAKAAGRLCSFQQDRSARSTPSSAVDKVLRISSELGADDDHATSPICSAAAMGGIAIAGHGTESEHMHSRCRRDPCAIAPPVGGCDKPLPAAGHTFLVLLPIFLGRHRHRRVHNG